MRSKLLCGVAAIALTAAAVAMSAQAATARPWGWHRGFGWGGAVAAGVIGGALTAATSPLWGSPYYDYYPGYAYEPDYTYDYVPAVRPAAPGNDVTWCQAQYRSYNPATGMYLGFDGLHHPCP